MGRILFRLLALSALTAGATVPFSPVLAANRCVADLGRIDSTFCLSRDHVKNGASYSWSLDDEPYDLTSAVCITGDGTPTERRPLVIAVDRSQGHWKSDQSRQKLGVDNIQAARQAIQKIETEQSQNGSDLPVGLVLFSSDNNCQEYSGGTINVDGLFPCLYVPARLISDAAHRQVLYDGLLAAEDLYSDAPSKSASTYSVLANLVASDALGLRRQDSPGIMLLTDGLSYYEANPNLPRDNPFPHLQVGNYRIAQEQILTAMRRPELRGWHLAIGMNQGASPLFDGFHTDSFETMCDSQWRTEEDCNAPGFVQTDPATWPVNNLDRRDYLRSLAYILRGQNQDVVELTSTTATEAVLDRLRFGLGEVLPVTSVNYSLINQSGQGIVLGGNQSVLLPDLPADPFGNLAMQVSVGGQNQTINMAISTTKQAFNGTDFFSQEMLCSGPRVAAASTGYDPASLRLQGGAASCGVVAEKRTAKGVATEQKIPSLLILFPCLGLVLGLLLRGIKWRAWFANAVILLLASTLLVPSEHLQGAEDNSRPAGLNVINTRPSVDAIAQVEAAGVRMAPGSFRLGLFADYANDSVELGATDNKRVSSVVDNLFTIHTVAQVAIYSRTVVGGHLPYVHRADLQRQRLLGELRGGNLGQPGDGMLYVKVNIVRKRLFDWAVMPYIALPTGASRYLIGDEAAAFGLQTLASHRLGAWKWAGILGYLYRSKTASFEDIRAPATAVKGQVIAQAGVERVLPLNLTLGANLQSKIGFGTGSSYSAASPTEWSAIIGYRFLGFLKAEASVGSGLGRGLGASDYRLGAGIVAIIGG